MTAVLAGNRRQYDNYIREHQLDKRQYRCVTREIDLVGYRFDNFVTTGQWYLLDSEVLKLWETYRQRMTRT